MAQWTGVWQSFELLRAYERQTGVKSDYVIRIRNDVCGPGGFDFTHPN